MSSISQKPAITFQDYQSMCKTFVRARLENYVERTGLTWFDLFEKIDSPAYNREKFSREIDEAVLPQYHMRNYPQMKNYIIL